MTLTHVNITEIGPAGLPVILDLDDDALRSTLISAGVDVAAGSMGARLDVLLTRQDEMVLLRGSLRGEVWVACSRCLEPARVEVSEPSLALTFVSPRRADEHGGDEVELDAEDLSVFAHDGERIDLLGLVREVVILSIPMAPRCSAGCRGLEAGGREAHATDAGTAWKAALKKLT